jgi:predicted SprT family Zn-dependent metalloprotease
LAALNDEAKVKDTILHEIAHALVGAGHGHNHVWKRKCIEIGAKPERCYSSKEVETPKLRYYVICEGCGVEHQRAKRVNPLQRRACKCQSHLPWDKKKILTYKDRYAA